MNKKISVANLVMLSGGAVTLLFSFFAYYKLGNQSRSAWSSDSGAFVTTIPAILAIAMVVWCALELAGQKLPGQILTFTPNQLKATWGISAAGVQLAFLTVDTAADRGFGFWLMLLGSLAMAVGAVMALLGKGTEMVQLGGSSTPPPSYGTPPPPPGAGTPPPPPPPPSA